MLLLLLACAPPTRDALHAPRAQASSQRVRGGIDAAGNGMLSLHVLVTDESGVAMPCDTGELTVTVEVSSMSISGPYTTLDPGSLEIRCLGDGAGDLAMVVDNSGSEAGFLEPLQEASWNMIGGVLDAGGRASLVRVSTDSTVVQSLTSDAAALGEAVDGLTIRNGWTSLWDGVRLGNETLGGDARTTGDVDDFCDSTDRLGVVTFTDGQDNNSAGEQAYDHDAYPGDGIDTTFEDVLQLRSGGASTPMYTIGLGDGVDADALQTLADATGGRYLNADSSEAIADVFGLVSDYLSSSTQVCVEVPEADCGRVWVRVTATWTDGTTEVATTSIASTTFDCEVPAVGSTATVLLTLTNPGIDTSVAATLASNAVGYVSPVDDPAVLVVLDDNHHDEFRDDAAAVADMLADAGWAVTYLEEGADGVTSADLRPYDVVWYANPGYPMDEEGSAEALLRFAGDGGGLVVQGDDMSWSWGNAFSMGDLTHLDHGDNGTSFCGARTDNNEGESFRVWFDGDGHPLTSGLDGESFTYGDDIDRSTPRDEGEEVLAWATLDGRDDCDVVPVVLAWQP